jgi:hypothetical protein
VENQGFVHFQALKIRDLESYENSQGREKDLGKNIVGKITCCYEH